MVIPGPVKLSVAVPVFCRLTLCDVLFVPTTWLVNVRLAAPSVTEGATPVPVSATVCGLPGNGSLTVMAPLRTPVAVGLKVTLTVQFAAGASVADKLVAETEPRR